MSRRGENIRKRKDGRWEGRYIKGYDSKKQKARYASVYGKTYAETKQKLDEAKYKSSIGVVYVDAKNKLFGEIINSWFNAKKINLKPSSIIKYQNLIEKHILGFDIKSLSEILGHSNVSITLNKYVHPSMQQKRLQMDYWNNIKGQIYGQVS